MNITLITVGKLKEKYLKDAVYEYSKRMGSYCKLEIIELPDEKIPDNPSVKEQEMVKEKEGQRILKCVKENSFVIALEIQGKMLDSNELAEKINMLGLTGKSNITFVIGGSLGLDESVLRRSDFSLSFSKMTFPHQLMRIILLEQIYRSFRIIHNEPYHK